ncbi:MULTISPECIES: DUF2398 family protein [Sporomusa]|uniref:DUF2398 family protein n=1 Tax=Sporomusa TaxID=2375 RepID=UPI001CB7EA4D|nr:MULTISPECIES: DUF2398 family protein [Sporomusa]MCM0759092.1 DUF2398 family protein [Sporomusa sphaeroides DSM 2875]
MNDDLALLGRVAGAIMPDEEFRLGARRLVERDWIAKDDEKATPIHLRRTGLSEMFRELCGWELIGADDEPFYRLVKMVARPTRWMGMSPRTDNHKNRCLAAKIDHVLFAATLAWLYSRPRLDDHMLLKDLAEGVMGQVNAHSAMEVDWTVRDTRLSLQRVLKVMRDEMGVLAEYDAGPTGGIEGMDREDSRDSVLAFDSKAEALLPMPPELSRMAAGDYPRLAMEREAAMEPMRSLSRKLLLFPFVNAGDMTEGELAFIDKRHEEYGRMLEALLGLRLEYANRTAALVYGERSRDARQLCAAGNTKGKLIFAFGWFLRKLVAEGEIEPPEHGFVLKMHEASFAAIYERFADDLRGRFTASIDQRLAEGWREFLRYLGDWNLASMEEAPGLVVLSPALGRLSGQFHYVYMDEGGADDDQE